MFPLFKYRVKMFNGIMSFSGKLRKRPIGMRGKQRSFDDLARQRHPGSSRRPSTRHVRELSTLSWVDTRRGGLDVDQW